MDDVSVDPAGPLIALGVIYLLSLVGDWVGRHTPVPRVALLLAAGYLLGPEAVGLISESAREWFPLVADIALVMVGFLVGGMLTRDALREHGRAVLLVSATVTLCTFLIVFVGLTVAGISVVACLVLAAVATATDPAATLDTVRSTGSRGPFSTTLTGIVAMDDAWGLVAFSVALDFEDDAWFEYDLVTPPAGGDLAAAGYHQCCAHLCRLVHDTNPPILAYIRKYGNYANCRRS